MNWRQIWNRLTQPNSDRGRSLLYIPRTEAGLRITHESALTNATVWACVRVICEAISQLPWRCLQRTSAGSEISDTSWADYLLHLAPNEDLTPAVWRECMLRDVLTWGNGYSEIERDGSNRPSALWPINPERVEPVRVAGLGVVYRIHNRGGEPTIIRRENMFHVRGLGDDLAGWSVIQHAANAIGLSQAQDQAMSSFLKNGSRPAGLLTPTGSLTRAAAEQIQREWEVTYGGSGNRGRTAVLSQSMTYSPMGLPNDDAQLLESRRFSVLDICRFFRVPPHKAMELERATFSNIEHQSIEFVQDTLCPWIVKLEQEANRKLIPEPMWPRQFTKININALLRGDFQSRATAYQMMFDRGVYSVNDILELEDRNTIGADGDKRFVPMNMTTLEKAGEEPEPPPQPPPQPVQPDDEPEGDEPDDAPETASAAYRPILRDCIERITAKECNFLVSGNKKRQVRLGYFGAEHIAYCSQQLATHCQMLASLGVDGFNPVAWAEQHVTQRLTETTSFLQLNGDLAELADMWREHVDEMTDEILGVQYA